MRKEHRNSKSPTSPFVQIRKVLCLIGFSAVVSPTITPSLTDHSFGSPSQPERLFPLKIGLNPDSESAAGQGSDRQQKSKPATKRPSSDREIWILFIKSFSKT